MGIFPAENDGAQISPRVWFGTCVLQRAGNWLRERAPRAANGTGLMRLTWCEWVSELRERAARSRSNSRCVGSREMIYGVDENERRTACLQKSLLYVLSPTMYGYGQCVLIMISSFLPLMMFVLERKVSGRKLRSAPTHTAHTQERRLSNLPGDVLLFGSSSSSNVRSIINARWWNLIC